MTDEITICECEAEVTKKNLKRHQQSQAHKDNMKSNSPRKIEPKQPIRNGKVVGGVQSQRKKEVAPLSRHSGATKFSLNNDTNLKEGRKESGNHADAKIKLTKSAFRIVLNEKYKTREEYLKSELCEETGRIRFPTRRKFGDYIYHTDRKLFDALFSKWKNEKQELNKQGGKKLKWHRKP